MVTICTTSLIFNNSTFCPHTVFMCFIWISEQTAIISLYSINWLVFTIETVFPARYGLDIYNSRYLRLSPRTPEFDSWPVLVGFVVDTAAQGQVFIAALRFCPVTIIPPLLRTVFIEMMQLPVGQLLKPGNPRKAKLSRKSGSTGQTSSVTSPAPQTATATATAACDGRQDKRTDSCEPQQSIWWQSQQGFS